MAGLVIAIAQRKGGAGKTTLAAQLAVAWARQGRLVTALDIDPQGSLAAWVDLRRARLGEDASASSLLRWQDGVLRNGSRIGRATPIWSSSTARHRVDLIFGSHSQLRACGSLCLRGLEGEVCKRLRGGVDEGDGPRSFRPRLTAAARFARTSSADPQTGVRPGPEQEIKAALQSDLRRRPVLSVMGDVIGERRVTSADSRCMVHQHRCAEPQNST